MKQGEQRELKTPQVCTVCMHPDCLAVEKAYTSGKYSMKAIAERYGVGYQALRRHLKNHLAARLVKLAEKREMEGTSEVLDPLRARVRQVELMLDACHEYLLDPDRPNQYYLGPRDEDISVVYLEERAGKQIKRRAQLSELLKRTGKDVIYTHWRHADPRKLVLEAMRVMEGVLMTIGRIAGYVKPAERKTVHMTQVNIYELMPNVMRVLGKYPKVKDEVIRAIEEAREEG